MARRGIMGDMIHLLLYVAAIVLFFVGALLAFRWFGTTNPEDALGWVSLGLAAFAAAHIPFAERA
jgi:hypothetical protein